MLSTISPPPLELHSTQDWLNKSDQRRQAECRKSRDRNRCSVHWSFAMQGLDNVSRSHSVIGEGQLVRRLVSGSYFSIRMEMALSKRPKIRILLIKGDPLGSSLEENWAEATEILAHIWSHLDGRFCQLPVVSCQLSVVSCHCFTVLRR